MNQKSVCWNEGAVTGRYGAGFGEWLRGAGALLRTWAARRAQRRHLRRLDPRLLKDIGVTRAEALAEAGKPFWRP